MTRKLILFAVISILLSACITKGTLDRIITINLNIDNDLNENFEILLKTNSSSRDEQTSFYFKKAFYDEEKYRDSPYVFSNYNELIIFQEKYIEFSYLNIFDNEYFEDNYLVLVLEFHGGSSELRNEYISLDYDKYYFIIEFWYRAPPPPGANFTATLFEVLYVLQIPKGN